jgi:hypothetical protein
MEKLPVVQVPAGGIHRRNAVLGPALGTGRHDGTRQNGTFDEYDSMACFRTTAIFDGVWPRPKFSTILHTAFHVYFGAQLATTLSRMVADAMMADEDRPMIPTIETAPKAAAAADCTKCESEPLLRADQGSKFNRIASQCRRWSLYGMGGAMWAEGLPLTGLCWI